MTQKAQMKPITADELRAQHTLEGVRLANTNLLAYALAQLKPGDERSNVEKLAAMTLEREQALTLLRRLAEQYGESDWPDGLALPEIIDKHIALPISVLLAKAPEKMEEGVAYDIRRKEEKSKR